LQVFVLEHWTAGTSAAQIASCLTTSYSHEDYRNIRHGRHWLQDGGDWRWTEEM